MRSDRDSRSLRGGPVPPLSRRTVVDTSRGWVCSQVLFLFLGNSQESDNKEPHGDQDEVQHSAKVEEDMRQEWAGGVAPVGARNWPIARRWPSGEHHHCRGRNHCDGSTSAEQASMDETTGSDHYAPIFLSSE